jgi:amidase
MLWGQERLSEGLEAATLPRAMPAVEVLRLGPNYSELVSPIAGFGSDELVHGRVANPYDLRRMPGGSSGGEAAVIAACGSACGLGNDSGGSVRTPAHFCGLATLKPTVGLVPMTGEEGALADPRTQTGALARFVADVTVITAVIAGPDPRHPEVAPVPIGDPAAVSVPGLRAAVLADNGLVAPASDVAATLTDAVAVLREAGLAVRDEPHAPGGHELTIRVWKSYRGEMGRDQLYDLLAEWDAYRVRMLEWFTAADVVLCPVYDRPAPAPDEHDDGLGVSYTTPYSLTGWPSAVVRCGTSTAGLPIGVQVVAHPWHDLRRARRRGGARTRAGQLGNAATAHRAPRRKERWLTTKCGGQGQDGADWEGLRPARGRVVRRERCGAGGAAHRVDGHHLLARAC